MLKLIKNQTVHNVLIKRKGHLAMYICKSLNLMDKYPWYWAFDLIFLMFLAWVYGYRYRIYFEVRFKIKSGYILESASMVAWKCPICVVGVDGKFSAMLWSNPWFWINLLLGPIKTIYIKEQKLDRLERYNTWRIPGSTSMQICFCW